MTTLYPIFNFILYATNNFSAILLILFCTTGIIKSEKSCGNVQEVVEELEALYCGQMSAEFMHLTVIMALNREWGFVYAK